MFRLLAPALALASGLLLREGLAAPHVERQETTWPNGPFTVSGRWILDASGKNVTYAGVNWSGHGEAMVPEGLQYQSIEYIVSMIKSVGINAVRLTFAIEMIDDIFSGDGKDVDLQTSFVKALGQEKGTAILSQVLTKNPQFTAETTRLQVFDAVAEELSKQEIYIHLDNHISRAMWCCSETDGNAWWGDKDFDIAKWERGMAYMAEHGKAWKGLTSIALRNEPRNPSNNPTLSRETYNWQHWYTYVRQGSKAVHDANPGLLIFLSGLSYDTYIEPVFQGVAFQPGRESYSADDFPGFADKLVLEIHNYETGIGSCSSLSGNLYRKGFQAMNSADPGTKNVFPVMLTEFGFAMDANTYRNTYPQCLSTYLPEQKAGFFIWVLSGSYYIRSGQQNFDEAWGLVTRDWSSWRRPEYINGAFKKMVDGVLAYTK